MRAPDFWQKAGGIADLLAPIGYVYGWAVSHRAGRRPYWHAPVPVICIGNVTAGGAGKTLIAIDFAARLKAAGKTPHILSRGYGGSAEGPMIVDAAHTAGDVGDEPLLLARVAPTWVGADRVASARAAVAAGADVLIMDDGFQNPGLAKTMSVLAVDGGYGFGNGLPMPAGPLREPIGAALKRARAIVLVGKDEAGAAAKLSGVDVLRAEIMPSGDPHRFMGARVFAFAGIGRPEKFFQTLRDLGAEIDRAVPFPDHHPFAAGEIESLINEAETARCKIVTTEKDHVRLAPALRDKVLTLPVGLDWLDATAVERLLSSALHP